MKKLLAVFVLSCLALPIYAEEEPQQGILDNLLDRIQLKREETRANQQYSPEEQVRRLKNELIDIRVERDLLVEENLYLREKLDNIRNNESSTKACLPDECISIKEAENEKLLQHVIYMLSMYRLVEFIDSVIPQDNVEAHKKVQRIMKGVKRDLELLGFDTTNPDNFPSLDELLKELDIAHEVHSNNLRTN